MKLLLGFLIFMLLIPVSLAQTINIDYQILYDKVLLTEKISFKEQTNLQFQLPEKSFATSVYGDNKQVSPINSIYNLENVKTIELNYLTKELLEKTSKTYFLTEIIPITNAENLTIKLILPENSILDKPVAQGSVFPKPSAIETDGQRISITWQYSNIKKDSSISLFVIFREKTNNLLIILILILIIISIAYFILKQKKQVKIIKKPKRKKIKEIEFHLIESEKSVIDALKKADRNELWQKQLQLQTGFSKAKLSRVIRNLESRNLIKKIPLGNTNKIILK